MSQGTPPMTSCLHPSPLSGDDMLLIVEAMPFEDAVRARMLALSLNGRWVPAHRGYILTSKRAELWSRLFAAGAVAIRSYRNGPGWHYHLGGREIVNQYEAIRRTKGAV